MLKTSSIKHFPVFVMQNRSGDYGKLQRSGERFSTGSRQQAEERDAQDADKLKKNLENNYFG